MITPAILNTAYKPATAEQPMVMGVFPNAKDGLALSI
jgi:hypothetical protein